MDFVNRFSGRGSASSQLDPNVLFKFTDLTVPVQQHLQRVYVTLCGALLAAAFGVYISIATRGWLGGWLAIAGFIGSSFWLTSTPPSPANRNKRYVLLAGAGFSQGLVVGPLVNAALHVSPGIVLTAFLATSAIFACFSGAAMVARRRSWLFLGGILSSAISALMVLRLGSWLFGGRGGFLPVAELYGGLIIFMGYVLFDTQLIIERAYAGEKDHVKHALDLFVDFAAIFVRILVILIQKKQREEEARRRSKRRS